MKFVQGWTRRLVGRYNMGQGRTLASLRTGLTGLSQTNFATAVNNQNKWPAPLACTQTIIADLENAAATTTYPLDLIKAITNYLSQQSGYCLDYGDVTGLSNRVAFPVLSASGSHT